MSCRDFLTFRNEFVRFGSRQTSSERKRFSTRCPTPCAGKLSLRGSPASRRTPDFGSFRPSLLPTRFLDVPPRRAVSDVERTAMRTPSGKAPRKRPDAPCADRHERIAAIPHEEPRARPRSLRSDGKETCALTMVPGRTPFCVPLAFPSPNARPAFRTA